MVLGIPIDFVFIPVCLTLQPISFSLLLQPSPTLFLHLCVCVCGTELLRYPSDHAYFVAIVMEAISDVLYDDYVCPTYGVINVNNSKFNRNLLNAVPLYYYPAHVLLSPFHLSTSTNLLRQIISKKRNNTHHYNIVILYACISISPAECNFLSYNLNVIQNTIKNISICI